MKNTSDKNYNELILSKTTNHSLSAVQYTRCEEKHRNSPSQSSLCRYSRGKGKKGKGQSSSKHRAMQSGNKSVTSKRLPRNICYKEVTRNWSQWNLALTQRPCSLPATPTENCRLSWDALTNDVSLQQCSDSICLRKFVHEADRNSVAIAQSENCQTSDDGYQLNWLGTITRRQVWNTLIVRASRRLQDC